MKKGLLSLILLIFAMTAFAFAAPQQTSGPIKPAGVKPMAYVDPDGSATWVDLNVNNVYHMGSNKGAWSYYTDTFGMRYPKNAGTGYGGRSYLKGPWLIWGNHEGTYDTTLADPSLPMSYDSGTSTYTGGFMSGAIYMVKIPDSPVTVNGGVYSGAPLVSNAPDSDSSIGYHYYQPNLYQGQVENRWPFNAKEYAYIPSSFELYETQSEVYLSEITAGTGIYHLFVVDPSTLPATQAELYDYYLEWSSADSAFLVYRITGYDENDLPQIEASSIGTVPLATDTVIDGIISINLNYVDPLNVENPLVDGDSYLIRARGAISDQDSFMVFDDSGVYGDFAAPDNYALGVGQGLGIRVYTRTYAWTISYADSAIIFDVTYENTSSRTYDQFAVGAWFWGYIATQYNDAMQYNMDEEIVMVYDIDGEQDGDEDWDFGEYGSTPYGVTGVQFLKPLTTESGDIATRYTVHQDIFGMFYYYGGSLSQGTVSGVDKSYIAGGGATNAAAGWGPADTRADGSWIGFLQLDDQYDSIADGHIIYYEYDPADSYWAGEMYASFSIGSADVTLLPGEKANFAFGLYVVPKTTAGWSNGQYMTAADPAYTAAVEMGAGLKAIFNNRYSTAVPPPVPESIAQGYVDERYLLDGNPTWEDTDNNAIQIYWNKLGEALPEALNNPVVTYKIYQFNGTAFESIFEFLTPNVFDITFMQGYPAIWEFNTVEHYIEGNIPNLINNGIIYVDDQYVNNIRFIYNLNETNDEVIGYTFLHVNRLFGYEYKYILTAVDSTDVESMKSGTAILDLVAAIDAEPMEHTSNKIKVVPNPLFYGTQWDKSNKLSEVKFNHLPPVCTIKIYTITGDLVVELNHDNGLAWEKWNLLNKYRQEVAPGMYIWVVESEGTKAKGKFAIIR